MESNKKKKKYETPKIKSEKLLSYGALCGGKKKASGGRKASTGAPNFCNASKLLS